MMQSRQQLESCVAGCILLSGGESAFYVDVSPDDFLYPPAKIVLQAATELKTIDSIIVKSFANSKGETIQLSDITEMINFVPTSKNILHYVKQLKCAIYHDKVNELRRALVYDARSGDLVKLASEIQQKEAVIAEKYLETPIDANLTESSADLLQRIEKRIDNENLISTGWRLLDEMLGGGLLPNELMILAARPSVGKTAAALQISLDCMQKVVLFSLEMSKAQISPRLLSAIALKNTKIATRQPSQLHEEVRRSLLEVGPELMQNSERIRVIDQHDLTIESIRRIAKQEVEDGAKIILLDYLQLLDKPGAQSRERAVSQISRDLKNMTKELNTPVICLAQMNRSVESEKRLPRLSDLRESGAIEQDANVIVFIHKLSEMQDGKKQVAIIQAKGRDVGEGYRKAIFNPDHQRFYEIEG